MEKIDLDDMHCENEKKYSSLTDIYYSSFKTPINEQISLCILTERGEVKLNRKLKEYDSLASS